MRSPLALLGAALMVCTSCADQPVGSEARPFTMYFVPSVEAETIATSADDITAHVERYVSQKMYGADEGFHVESALPTSYVAVVEALGTDRADLAAFNTFGYILARDIKHYDVEALLAVVRGDGELTYKAQILARADSGIKNLEDLEGKRFAYSDPASTAGYVLPSRLFADKGIELGETVFAQGHTNVVSMVYNGQVDAGATYYSPPKQVMEASVSKDMMRDARARVLTQYPDVEEKVVIIGYTEETPNEPWVVRKNLFEDAELNKNVKQWVREALFEYAESEQGKVTLEQLYNISGLAPIEDSVYEPIRKMVLDAGIDLEAAMKK